MPTLPRLPITAALASLSFALVACSDGGEPAPVEAAAAASRITIANARLVLPAVSGNPAAAYFELVNNTEKVAVLTALDVAQAERTEMHETTGSKMVPIAQLAVQPGEQVEFAPGGKHVMVFGPPATAAGATVAMTFRFEDGRTEKAQAKVQPAGRAASDEDDHAGMAH